MCWTSIKLLRAGQNRNFIEKRLIYTLRLDDWSDEDQTRRAKPQNPKTPKPTKFNVFYILVVYNIFCVYLYLIIFIRTKCLPSRNKNECFIIIQIYLSVSFLYLFSHSLFGLAYHYLNRFNLWNVIFILMAITWNMITHLFHLKVFLNVILLQMPSNWHVVIISLRWYLVCD